MQRSIHNTIFLLYLLLFIIPISYASTDQCKALIVEVQIDGGTWIYENITVSNAPANITVPLQAPPLILYAEDVDGVPLPVSYTNTTATITAYDSGIISLKYYTLNLTSKTGSLWALKFTAPCDTLILLPRDAIPVSTTPQPAPVVYKGEPALKFSKNTNIIIKYYIIPGGLTGESTPTKNYSTTPQNKPTISTNLATIIVIIIIIAGAGGLLYTQRTGRKQVKESKPEIETTRLDERDRAILEALKHKPMTALELQQNTGIPKTPLYRRLRKLIEEGLIEYYEEEGVRVYRLKK